MNDAPEGANTDQHVPAGGTPDPEPAPDDDDGKTSTGKGGGK